MKLLTTFIISLGLSTSATAANAIDGTWVYERTAPKGEKTLKMSQAFNLKAEGKKVTGTIVLNIDGKAKPPIEIKTGAIEGKKFSFQTETSTTMGTFRTKYEGVVDAGAIKGTLSTDGKSAPFEAKKK